ncbi:hypothetical protein PF008_g2029 [Phytophthora fragariae]|uniref:Uncharacterized protein n=1 Tax=Phytophthora fragariae TaxID=53985 RepID=A0A6G0SIL9_9STRA|nr:hypothetical protein PF008_g2029 [Phytophthora fragariae]
MSGGNWPKEFKIRALSGKLEGTALIYFEKMVPGWTAVSNTLEYVMNSMLMLYITPIPSAKGIELMSKEKDPSKTWPEHYQYLVYVAERSGNSEQCVLKCLCKSSPAYIRSAMLTRLNSQRIDHLQQAAELASFAIEHKASNVGPSNGSGGSSTGRTGRGHGRHTGGGYGGQSGRGD